jgi:hypothetical protein
MLFYNNVAEKRQICGINDLAAESACAIQRDTRVAPFQGGWNGALAGATTGRCSLSFQQQSGP